MNWDCREPDSTVFPNSANCKPNRRADSIIGADRANAVFVVSRAEKSRLLMQEMMTKYEAIRTKVDTTRECMARSAEQAERRNKLQQDIRELKERAERATDEYLHKQVVQVRRKVSNHARNL